MNSLAGPFADDLPERPKVLLVDDDEVNLLLTSVALRDQGFAVTEASSGEKAMRVLADWLPDVVVLDALMPGLDGFETCKALRLLPGCESLPVLMLTGLDDDASIAHAYEVGATDFFVKATQWSLLAGRLRYLLRASRTRAELERSKSRLARAQDLARMGSFDWKRGQGGPLYSVEGLRVFGFGPGDQPSFRSLLRMVPEEERSAFLELTHSAMDRSTVLATDIHARLGDGRQRIVHIEAEPEFNEHGNLIGYTGIVQDVTDRRLAEDRIRHLANFDTLTGLPNRRQLIWRAERSLEHGRRLGHQVALLLIDLDRFKIVNDTLGHGAGDELLMEVSRRLRSCVRHSDQVLESSLESVGVRSHRTLEAVGRLGGDEFVALLPEVIDEGDAERVATRILEVMRTPITIGMQECFVTASVGIALFPRDGQTVADLLRNSDVAMYAAKSAGRNASSLYRPTLAGRGREKLELESALHKAIERNELVLHYQPKIDVRGAKMVGAEALMRWRRHGVLVAPGDFIPLAEETGLIIPLSEWAIREAARQARVWHDNFGFDDSIAVNLPNRLFERTDLVEYIHNAVTTYGVPHRMIELEITETGLMKDLQNVIPALHRLNEIGVEISIDDFGTGYSSLAYLKKLPLHELKIDRSFVMGMETDRADLKIVRSTVDLAHNLGYQVVAEGVETAQTWAILREMKCDMAQGFFMAKPMPEGDIEGWLGQWSSPQTRLRTEFAELI